MPPGPIQGVESAVLRGGGRTFGGPIEAVSECASTGPRLEPPSTSPSPAPGTMQVRAWTSVQEQNVGLAKVREHWLVELRANRS